RRQPVDPANQKLARGEPDFATPLLLDPVALLGVRRVIADRAGQLLDRHRSADHPKPADSRSQVLFQALPNRFHGVGLPGTLTRLTRPETGATAMPEMRRGCRGVDSPMILWPWTNGPVQAPGALPFWPVIFGGKMSTFCPPSRADSGDSGNSCEETQNKPRSGFTSNPTGARFLRAETRAPARRVSGPLRSRLLPRCCVCSFQSSPTSR